MTNGISHEESYGHFYDTENPEEESSKVEYVVLYSETHYKVCKKVWCQDTRKYRIYYAPSPYSYRRNPSTKESNSRERHVSTNANGNPNSTPSGNKKPFRQTNVCEYIQVAIGISIILGYIALIGMYARL
jgi:hypothetical protein